MEKTVYISITLCSLVLVTGVLVWTELFRSSQHLLSVSFLDVGQGDAIFIEAPSGRQVLVDGGPDRSVLRELPRLMSSWDRSIDVVVATHPDADHISGLIDVLERYDVSYVFEPGVANDTPQSESLLTAVADGKVTRLLARRGQIIDLGSDAYIQILFPDRGADHLETNTASIVARLVYHNVSVMLTGDSPQAIEEYLVDLDGSSLHSSILKVGHHGSQTSSSLLFVGFVDPDYAILSRGCDNSYGHPHAETLDTLSRLSIESLDTCTDGTITFYSDGDTLWLE